MKISISELLSVIAMFGLACVALRRVDPLFETIFFSLTLALVLASVLIAIGTTGGVRVFFTGFAVSSLLYLLFAHVPDADEEVPRHNGPEVTTQLLRQVFNWMHVERYETNFAPSSGVGDYGDDESMALGAETGRSVATGSQIKPWEEELHPFPTNLSIGTGQTEGADGQSVAFMRIGHAAWALLLGWIGGHVSQVAYARSRIISATPSAP